MATQGRGYSQSEKHSIEYRWEINEITSFINSAKDNPKEKVLINSSVFSTNARTQDLWYLQLAMKQGNESWISLFLMPKKGAEKLRAEYLLFYLTNSQEKKNPRFDLYDESSDPWISYLFEKSKFGHGYHQFIKVDELLEKKNALLQNDTLTVGVELVVYDNYQTINSVTKLKYSRLKLASDLKDLLASKNKCDVVIKVANENFDAHKVILSARSCVFDAMFSHEMKENKQNEVTIPDIEPEVFRKVLDYIYTDKVEDLNSFVEKLLEASDKYQLQGLKEMCENVLLENLKMENAIRILVLADRHDAVQLKEVIINYVIQNFDNFKNTEEFKDLEYSQLSLFLILLKKSLAIEY